MKDFVLANVVFSSKQKALDRINEIDGVIEIINQLVEEYINTSTDTSSGWIDCSERLPNVGVTVLCYWGKSSICENTTSYYYTLMHRNEDNIWISDFGICIGFVIAWMPLPAPYKEGV